MDHEYFAASFFTVFEFRNVVRMPIVFSSNAPENLDSLNFVRQSQ